MFISANMHDEKPLNLYSPVAFSVGAQTSLKQYRERLLFFDPSSSLSHVDDVFFNFGKKEQSSHCTMNPRRLFIVILQPTVTIVLTVFLHKDVATSSSVLGLVATFS